VPSLPDGSKVTSGDVLIEPKDAAIYAREAAIQTIGNLTLLHYGTNRAAQHHAFKVKRDLFVKNSNLHLNREMLTASTWDEAMIQRRAESLYQAAVRIWPGPLSPKS
jgi:hypothetical protein